jgi:signal recognition particle receptor subunit beta
MIVVTILLSAFRKDPDDDSSQKKPKEEDKEKTAQPQKKENPVDDGSNSSPKDEKKEENSVKKETITEVEETKSKDEEKEQPKTEPKPSPSPVKSSNKYNKIILYGSSNSFKTQLFYSMLLDKKPSDFTTVTSVSPNASENFNFNGKKTTLIDIPGHSNFESKIGKYLEKNCLLVFILRTGSSEHNYLSKSAHKLYEILTKHDLEALQITISLIFVKDKEFGGKEEEKEFIKEFEKEIERIKFSRRTHVNTEEGTGSTRDYLKEIKQNFVLDHIRAKHCGSIFLDLETDTLKNKLNSI